MKTSGIIVLLFILLAANTALSQGLYPCQCKDQEKDIYGYCDSLSGKIKIDCKFDSAYNFVKGLARVMINNRFGFINTQGILKIPAEYDHAADFSEGFAAVKKNQKYFFIDQNNINPFGRHLYFANPKTLAAMTQQQLKQFGDPLSSFSNGLALVYDTSGYAGYINTKGIFVIKPKYLGATSFGDGIALVMEKSNEPIKAIDKTGNKLFDVPNGWFPDEAFSNGAAIVKRRKKNEFEYNVLNTKGNLLFEDSFYEVSRLGKNYFQLYKVYGRCAIAAADGKIIISADTSKIFGINEKDQAGNYPAFLYDEKARNNLGDMILLNKDFKKLTSRSYNFITEYKDGFYQPYQRQSGDDILFGLLSKEGKEILPPNYQMIRYNASDKLIFVKTKQGKEGLYDYTGKTVLKEDYNNIEGWEAPGKTKVLVLSKDGKQGFATKAGTLITPLKYTRIDFSDYGENSYYAIEIDNKIGVADLTGKEVIAPKYNKLFPEFEEGCPFYSIEKDGKFGWVDNTGKVLLPPIYEDYVTCPGKESFAVGKLSDNEYVFINKSGQHVFGKKYEYASSFEKGIAIIEEKGKFGLINATGKYMVQPAYDEIERIHENYVDLVLYAVTKDNNVAFMDKALKIITPFHFDVLKVENEEYFGASEGMIAVKKADKWGFMDITGKLVIPCIYDAVGLFSDGIADVTYNNEQIRINKKGERQK